MMGVEQYKIILDLPSEQPTLAFDQYARAFQEVIEKSNPRFAIGIFGGWGSGKTTLMQAIGELLDKDRVIPVWFNAWRYEKEEHLIIPLLDVVRESLLLWSEKHPDKKQVVQKTASTLGKAVKSLLAGSSLRFGVPGAVNMTLDAGKVLAENRRLSQEELDALLPRSVYHSSFRELSDAFEEFAKDDPKRRIVVFVDDLDRCLPEGALEVLESMKLFFDLPGFVFVVGLDQNIVERLIDSKYGKTVLKPAQEEIKTDPRTNEEEIKRDHHIRGSDYVKKIFQVPIQLPQVAVDQVPQFLQSLCFEAGLSDEQRDDIMERVRPHLVYVIEDAGVNPREIKRYINTYTIQLKVKPYLDRDTILTLQTLNFRRDWQESIYEEGLLPHRDLFIRALRRQVLENDPNALRNLHPQLAAVPSDFLAYVSPGGPGHSLLETQHNLDEYIYIGESVHSRVDPGLLDAFDHLAQAREKLRTAGRADTAEQRQEISKVLTEELVKVHSLLGNVHWAARIRQDLDALKQQLGRVDPGTFDAQGWETWHGEQLQSLDKIKGDLITLRRYASLSPTS